MPEATHAALERLMLGEGARRRLAALDHRLVEIATWVNTSRLLNPTLMSRQRALGELRQGLRSGRFVDPHLVYLPLPHAEIAASYEALRALTFEDTPVDALLAQQRDALLAQLELLEARGTPRFGEVAAAIYGLPSPELLERARASFLRHGDALASLHAHAETPRMSAADLQRRMEAELVALEILDWSVVRVDEMSARMSVSARHREVRIKSDAEFTEEDSERLVVHELHTHVMRAHRGFQTGLLNLGLGLEGYLATEEGLASHMEERHGLLHPHHLAIYALRALGVALGHERGFAATLEALMELGVAPGIAWDVTIRVKRGLSDTSAPGCFPKDYVYLQGREVVSDHLACGGTLEELFIGKIAVEQLPQVRELLAAWGGGEARS